jgi:histidinol-phosphate/aromatic aminotransferase/cobyric acid decarboxylase-like protein
MIGNPTNPTSALYPATLISSLCREGRIVVVDEAFMDCVPGEPETMISDEMTGQLVIRSLTKTWGLAGLRTGYLIGDPSLIAALRAQQPPWSVSTPAPTWLTSSRRSASALQASRRHHSYSSTPAAYAATMNLAGSAWRYGITVSPYAEARPFPASGQTG